jgi:hypothetical protein
MDAREADPIASAKSDLREHMGIDGRRPPPTTVHFFVEKCSFSAYRGAGCNHVTCKDRIEAGSYRIAVLPGMHSVNGGPGMSFLR